MECWQVKIFSKIISLRSKRKVVQLSAIFFLGLIVLNGCKKKEDGIGLNVQPQGDQLNVELIDTASIITYSIKEDSLKSDELDGPSMLGTYVDPYFGKMDASIVSQIRLEASVDFTLASGSLDSLVIDSVIMYLALQGSFGNLDPQTFEVYQINEDIELIDLGDATSSNALKDILNNLKTIFITQALGKNEEAIEILNYVIMIKRIYNCFSELLEDIGKLDNNQIADLSEVKRQDQQESFIDACELIDSLNSNLQLYFGYLDITPPAAAGAAEATGADES